MKEQIDFKVPLAKTKVCKSGDKIRVHRKYIHKYQIHFKSKHRFVLTALYKYFNTYRI